MILSLIAAASANNVIGKNNGLPWSLPNDMRFFKNTTWGMPLIMGRKTFDSMNGEPFNGRINIIISNQKDFTAKGAVVVKTLSDALFVARDADVNEVFIIGGGEIFKEAIKKADRIYLTRVHAIIDGDVFFPEVDEKKWKRVSSRDCFADDRHKYDYTFEVWEKQ